MRQAALYTREGCKGKTWVDMCHRPARCGAWRRPSLPALQGAPWCGIDLHKRYRRAASSSLSKRIWSGFASPFRLAGSSRPQLRNVPFALSLPSSIFREDVPSERKIAKRRRPGIRQRNGSYLLEILGSLLRPIFPAMANRNTINRIYAARKMEILFQSKMRSLSRDKFRKIHLIYFLILLRLHQFRKKRSNDVASI